MTKTKPIYCPWCGEEPRVVDDSGVMTIVWCANEACPVKPELRDYVSVKKLSKRWASWFDFLWMDETQLKRLRAKINGKLSKRVITPEQQAKIQAARQKVI